MSERSTSEHAHAGTCGPILADCRHPLRRCPAAGATGRATQSGWSEPVLVAAAFVALMLAFNYVFNRPMLANLDRWRDYVGPAVGMVIFGILRFRAGMRSISGTESRQSGQ